MFLTFQLHKSRSILFEAEENILAHKFCYDGIILEDEDDSSNNLCVEDVEGYEYSTHVNVTFTERPETEQIGTIAYIATSYEEDSKTSFPCHYELRLPVDIRLSKFLESSDQFDRNLYITINVIDKMTDGTWAIQARGEWQWKTSICNPLQARIKRIGLIPVVQKPASEKPFVTTECKDQNALHTPLIQSEVGTAAHLAELRKIRVLLIVAIVFGAINVLANTI